MNASADAQPSSNLSTPFNTPRDNLVASLSLRYDPFRHRVTEQERELSFAEIYVEPEDSLLARLQRPCSTLVFAGYGMGKSATRLALEYELRLKPGPTPTLCVRYTDITNPIENLDDLCLHLGQDMVIQSFERTVTSSGPLSAQFIEALQRQSATLSSELRLSRLKACLADPPESGVFWDELRPVVEPLSVNQRWKELLGLIIEGVRKQRQVHLSWDSSVQDARTLGFDRIDILIDSVDIGSVDPRQWIRFLTPLLRRLSSLQQHNIFLKCFLPTDVEDLICREFGQTFEVLTPAVDITTIDEMSVANLGSILRERLQASKNVRSATVSLDMLAGADIDQSIEGWLAEHAHGSPRRLLRLASRLIDFHVDHGFREANRTYLTANEWRLFQAEILRECSGEP